MLTVEDGTGVMGADSLASVEEADLLHARRGNMSWVNLPTSSKEDLLREASDFIGLRLRDGGEVASPLQGFPWPYYQDTRNLRLRSSVVTAVAMLADIARLGPLMGGAAQGGRVLSESKTLGPLSKSTTYSDRQPTPSVNGRDLSFIDTLLAPLLATGGGMVIGRVSRG